MRPRSPRGVRGGGPRRDRPAVPFYLVRRRRGRNATRSSTASAWSGPWVAVPAHGRGDLPARVPRAARAYVGGTDSRASSASVRVWFDGQLGAPIAPEQSRRGAVLLFHAATNNGRPGWFQPTLGCVSLTSRRNALDGLGAQSGPLPGTNAGAALDLHAKTIFLHRGHGPAEDRDAAARRRTAVGSWSASRSPRRTRRARSVSARSRSRTVEHRTPSTAVVQTAASMPFVPPGRGPGRRDVRAVSELLSLHHFSFASPDYLLVLLARSAAARRSRRRSGAGGPGTRSRSRTWSSPGSRHGGGALAALGRARLLALAFAATAAALARPHVQLVAADPSATIVLLVDVSGSMQATDVVRRADLRRRQGDAPVHRRARRRTTRSASSRSATRSISSTRRRPITPPSTARSTSSAPRADGARGRRRGGGEAHPPSSRRRRRASRAGPFLSGGDRARVRRRAEPRQLTPVAAAALAKAAGIRIFGVALGTRDGHHVGLRSCGRSRSCRTRAPSAARARERRPGLQREQRLTAGHHLPPPRLERRPARRTGTSPRGSSRGRAPRPGVGAARAWGGALP